MLGTGSTRKKRQTCRSIAARRNDNSVRKRQAHGLPFRHSRLVTLFLAMLAFEAEQCRNFRDLLDLAFDFFLEFVGARKLRNLARSE